MKPTIALEAAVARHYEVAAAEADGQDSAKEDVAAADDAIKNPNSPLPENRNFKKLVRL